MSKAVSLGAASQSFSAENSAMGTLMADTSYCLGLSYIMLF